MRFGQIALLLLLVQRVALAHDPGSVQTLPQRIGHQLIGLHHLPVTALLVLVAVVIARRYLTRHSSEAN